MPPLPADSIHARACKLKCEKILTRPKRKIQQGEKPLLDFYIHWLDAITDTYLVPA